LGPVLAEIFGMICRFCHFLPKGTETLCEIFGVSGLIFTKIAKNVAKSVPFIASKSELRYLNPLRMASVLNKGHLANFAQILGNLPKGINKVVPIEKIHANIFNLVKRS